MKATTPTTPSVEEAEATLHAARMKVAELDARFSDGDAPTSTEWAEARHNRDYAERVLEAAQVAHDRADEARRRAEAADIASKLRSRTAETTAAIVARQKDVAEAVRNLAAVTTEHNRLQAESKAALQQLSSTEVEGTEKWISDLLEPYITVSHVHPTDTIKAAIREALIGVPNLQPIDHDVIRGFELGAVPASNAVRAMAARLKAADGK